MPDRVPDTAVTAPRSAAHVPTPAAARRLYPYQCRALADRADCNVHAGDVWCYATAVLPGGIVRVLDCGDKDVVVRALPAAICKLEAPPPSPAAPAAPAPAATPAARPADTRQWESYLDTTEGQ